MSREHHYRVSVEWTGNNGPGTISASAYERSHTVHVAGKPIIFASSDTPFRGDATKHNPEDFLLSALSSCHMLWYLHLCADAGVIVTSYKDNAQGVMVEKIGGGGNFLEVLLQPEIGLQSMDMQAKADELHEAANKKCFIANSCNFPVKHKASYHKSSN